MFSDFPDVVTITDVQKMLGIGKNTAYSLVQSNTIQTVRVGRKYIIPKKSVIRYLDQPEAR